MAPQGVRYNKDGSGTTEAFFLPGSKFALGEVNIFATYDSKQVWAYPMFKLPLFWFGTAFFAFAMVYQVIAFTELWPNNLWIDIHKFQLGWWIGAGICMVIVAALGLMYNVTYRFMSHHHRAVIMLYVLMVVTIYLDIGIRLLGFRITYPSPNKHLIQVYADWNSVLNNIAFTFYPLIIAYGLFFMALFYPVKCTFALTNRRIGQLYDFFRSKGDDIMTAE